MNVSLEVTEGPGKGRIFNSDCHDVLLVGRSSRCHWAIGPDRSFSRIHLLIEVTLTASWMRTLESKNPTSVNGCEVKEAQLRDGDVIRAGKTTMVVSIAPSPELGIGGDFAPLALDTFATLINDQDGPDIPGYRIICKHRAGGMSDVWLAEEIASKQQVIVKTPLSELAVKPEARKLFIREQKHSLSMHHRNIVKFIDAGECNGNLFIVMEYVPGKNALEICEPRLGRRLPYRDVVEIGIQSLEGLAHAHQQNVVHRDIKPPNILIVGDSVDSYHVKVTDFGISRNFRAAGISSLTQPGQVRGSVGFMPPEQVVDCRGVDHRADIFSMGATLYTMLTGESVYAFRLDRDNMVTVAQGDIIALGSRSITLPSLLVEVIDRSIDPNILKRYQSARDMKTALEKVRSVGMGCQG